MLRDNILFAQNQKGNIIVVIPPIDSLKFVRMSHEDKLLGHWNQKKLKMKIQNVAHVDRLNHWLTIVAKTCSRCIQEGRIENKNARFPVQEAQYPISIAI